MSSNFLGTEPLISNVLMAYSLSIERVGENVCMNSYYYTFNLLARITEINLTVELRMGQ
jgi:hypothetical protein